MSQEIKTRANSQPPKELAKQYQRRSQPAEMDHLEDESSSSSSNLEELIESNGGPTSKKLKTGAPEKSKMVSDDNESTCFICSKQNVEFGERIYESGWIICSFNKDTDDPCSASAHTDCIGFPGMIEDTDIEHLPDFYCPQHRQRGRALQNVKSTYL